MPQIANRVKIFALLGLFALSVMTAHSMFVSMPGERALAVFPECSDGIDNDVDGLFDFPQDPDCESQHDDSEGFVGPSMFISLSDGLDEVKAGGSLTYTISLRTDKNEPQLTDVRFFLPELINLMSASENGKRDGAVVRWRDVMIHPGYVKTLYVSIEVHRDAKEGQLLIAEAIADGEHATDTTIITEANTGIAPMEIFVDDGKIFAEPDEELRYQITVKNHFAPARTLTLHTHLPPYLRFINATGEFKRDHRSIEWHDQYIDAGETLVYELFGVVERDAEEFTSLRLRAFSEAAIGTDTTTVLYKHIPPAALEISVSDGHTTAVNGEKLTYDIVIRNNQGKLLTGVDVKNALPTYTEFVSATEGGYWTGKDVYWKDITISPFGRRLLQVTLRVRSDAPLGAQLKNTVHAAGREAVDMTEVSTISSGKRISQRQTANSVMLRKVADRMEARPGDTVTYSIYLRNTLDHPIRNIRVEDRMDLNCSTVLDAERGQMLGDSIVWTVPSLNPGEEWNVRYTIRINENTPHGMQIANVVTVTGEGMETISLTERVRTSRLSIVTELPKSGAPLDVIFAGVLALLSSVPTMWIRRRSLV